MCIRDRVGAVVQPRAAAHQGPETGAVLATSGVVEVRQTEVVAELVGEDTEATVLGLGGVVTDPHPGVTYLGTSSEVARWASGTKVCGVDVPAVGPDGVRALRAAAGFFALPGVNRLEVVDIAVGLVEVAVVVVVVAVDLVELRQVGLDIRSGLS